MNKFSICAWPAYATKKRNPYTYLIYKQIEKLGHPVREFYLSKALSGTLKIVLSPNCKIFHVHWPSSNTLKSKDEATALRRTRLLFFAFRIMKLSGKKIVWTVHELDDHDNLYPQLKQRIDKLLYSRVDGFISMNQKVLETLQAKLKGKNQKLAYIPHPHYKGYYANKITQAGARKALGLGATDFVFLFIGQIRDYKNVPGLIEAFNGLNKENTVLVIAGWLKSETLQTTIQNRIGAATNIKLFNTFVEDDDIQQFINASDLVVTPYKRIFNSGSVFLNLSFGKPTLGPDMYALSELKDALGNRWIKTYTGTLTPGVMEKAMAEVKEENTNKLHPDLDRFAPEEIAKETIEFYKSLIQG